MFERMMTIVGARTVLNGSEGEPPDLSSSHLRWIESLLSESPASLQDVPLGSSADGDVFMEWQAVFQGAGVGYIRAGGAVISVCLLLDGRFPVAEQAAIDAVQQMVQSGRARSPGIELVRKHHGRPLRAVILVDDAPKPETVALIEYWTDCLATAHFNTIRATVPGSDVATVSGTHVASAV